MNVYDFDKTIYIHDSSVDLVFYLLGKKPWLFFPYLPKALRGVFRYKVLGKSKEVMKEDLFSIFSYFDDREKLIEEFWDCHEKGIKSFYLLQKKDDDLIISASPAFLIGPICKRLHIQALASPLDIDTLRYSGNNCHGEEKVKRFREYTREEVNEFYSDSLSDSPMAQIAKKAWLVKGETIKEWPKEKRHEG